MIRRIPRQGIGVSLPWRNPECALGFVKRTLVSQCHASNYGAAPHVHVVDIYVVAAVVVETEHVHVAHCLAYNHALDAVIFEQPVALLQFLGFFESQLQASRSISPRRYVISSLCSPRICRICLIGIVIVSLVVDFAGAASAALAYMVLQAIGRPLPGQGIRG